MNFQEFVEYFARFKSVSALPRHPMSEVWSQLSEPISDHYNGRPSKKFLKHFPNEDDAAKCFRISIWMEQAKPILLQAVDDLMRVFKASKYSITFENPDMLDVHNAKRIDKKVIDDYALRMTEPQSVYVFWPNENQVSSEINTTIVDFDLLEVSYKRILNVTDNFIAFFAEGVDCDQYHKTKQLLFLGNILPKNGETRTVLHVVTDETYLKVDVDHRGRYIVYPVYDHDYNGVPFCWMGGRKKFIKCSETHKSYTVYESDFSGGLPHLGALELRYNQHLSVDLTSAFPWKFIQGDECESCHGQKKRYPFEYEREYKNNPDKQINCKECKGAGQVFPSSPLHGYYFRGQLEGATAEERASAARIRPVDFTNPDVDMCIYLRDNYNNAKTAAQEAFNVRRLTSFAQSAVSKQVDNESLHTQVERIANSVIDNIAKLYKIKQGLLFGDNDSMVSITRSVSLQLDDEAGLLKEYQDSLKGGSFGVRYHLYTDYIKKRFPTDTRMQRIEMLAAKYAPLYLLSQEERDRLKASNVPGIRRECTKAVYVFNLLCEIENINEMTDEAVTAELDRRIDEIINAETVETANGLLDDGAIQ